MDGCARHSIEVTDGVIAAEQKQLDSLRGLEPCLAQCVVHAGPVGADEFLDVLAAQPWIVRWV
jgi:hypothetical protein